MPRVIYKKTIWNGRRKQARSDLRQLLRTMTPTEIAAVLGVSEKTIYTWKRGVVPCSRVSAQLNKLVKKLAA
jgi:DNA-binding transcriptional regulator YiaG